MIEENLTIEEQQDLICKNIAQGENLGSITKMYNIDIEEVYAWLEARNHLKFQKRYKKVKEIKNDLIIEKMLKLADDVHYISEPEEYKRAKLKLDVYKQVLKSQNIPKNQKIEYEEKQKQEEQEKIESSKVWYVRYESGIEISLELNNKYKDKLAKLDEEIIEEERKRKEKTQKEQEEQQENLDTTESEPETKSTKNYRNLPKTTKNNKNPQSNIANIFQKKQWWY